MYNDVKFFFLLLTESFDAICPDFLDWIKANRDILLVQRFEVVVTG
jgi:hypothetical protein